VSKFRISLPAAPGLPERPESHKALHDAARHALTETSNRESREDLERAIAELRHQGDAGYAAVLCRKASGRHHGEVWRELSRAVDGVLRRK